MTEPKLDFDAYEAPGTDSPVPESWPGPRLRFWLACLWSLVTTPVLMFMPLRLRMPSSYFPLFEVTVLVAWLVPMCWVLAAHLRPSTTRFSIARMFIVFLGLSMAMAVFAFIGMGIAIALLGDFRIR